MKKFILLFLSLTGFAHTCAYFTSVKVRIINSSNIPIYYKAFMEIQQGKETRIKGVINAGSQTDIRLRLAFLTQPGTYAKVALSKVGTFQEVENFNQYRNFYVYKPSGKHKEETLKIDPNLNVTEYPGLTG